MTIKYTRANQQTHQLGLSGYFIASHRTQAERLPLNDIFIASPGVIRCTLIAPLLHQHQLVD